jgi:hypothetical protein
MARSESRFELKYRLPVARAEAFKRAIAPFTVRDAYAANEPWYLVNSIYFDSSVMDFYFDKIDGHRDRQKVRFRWYGEDSARGYLEIKEKTRSSVRKLRQSMLLETLRVWWEAGCNAALAPDVEPIRPEYAWLFGRYALRPVTLVRYLREPYEAIREDRVRITFDHAVVAGSVTLDAWKTGAFQTIFPQDFVILEMKFNDAIPVWLMDLVRAFQLTLDKISKYCLAVETIDEARENSARRAHG